MGGRTITANARSTGPKSQLRYLSVAPSLVSGCRNEVQRMTEKACILPLSLPKGEADCDAGRSALEISQVRRKYGVRREASDPNNGGKT
jgi:hypothetical protein